MNRGEIVDVDDRATWPPKVAEIGSHWANQYKGTTEYTSDLALPLEAESQFRELFAGRLLRAYHCTRLLPHEVAMVRRVGLRPLSSNLLRDRINAAERAGVISASDAEQMHAAHVFATGQQQHREDQVCLILSSRVFQYNLGGCEPLLTTWGGEGLYSSSGAALLPDRLKGLGLPTVVIALLDIGGRGSPHLFFPALHKVFVGAALGLADRGADIFYKSPVLSEHVERVLQAGDPAYARLGNLPM